MNPSTLETLTAQFTNLIGADVIAKAQAAIAGAQAAAAKAAAEVAAKAAATKAAAAAKATPPSAATVGAQSSCAQPTSALPRAQQDCAPTAAAKPAAATPATPRPAAPKPAPAAPRPAPAPAAPPIPPSPLHATPHALKGYHLDATVAPSQVAAAATILDYDGFALDAITGVDWIAQNEMEVVYDYFHPTEPLRVVVRARVPRTAPELPTISEVFPGANWHERETHDFFGIRFTGHPNLKPFLLPEDADFHPLRKDYAP